MIASCSYSCPLIDIPIRFPGFLLRYTAIAFALITIPLPTAFKRQNRPPPQGRTESSGAERLPIIRRAIALDHSVVEYSGVDSAAVLIARNLCYPPATAALQGDELKAKSCRKRRTVTSATRGNGRSGFKAKENTGMSALKSVSCRWGGVWLWLWCGCT